MIVITGAAGFIGSALVGELNRQGFKDLILVDDFSRTDKAPNHREKICRERIHRDRFIEWLSNHGREVDFVFHIGARTDTTEFDIDIFDRLNLEYSKAVFRLCAEHQIPLVYASSAATYGDGALGFRDDHLQIPQLQPLNPYGQSKQDFDVWVLQQNETPFFRAGLKFFNVFGPNEYHKGRMASVVFHAYRQILETGEMRLFRSHRPDYADGCQLRDFIYVKDVVSVLLFFMNHRKNSGIYNLGSGRARTFLDLVGAVFEASRTERNIRFVDIPADIRDTYQYHTEADMTKLRSIGYHREFSSIEEGIGDYVSNYLMNDYLIL